MQSFTIHTGIVAPLDRANVDTDLIIPKQFLKSVKRTGFGPNLFDQLRYLDEGQPGMEHGSRPINPDFVLNKEQYRTASVLLARENFGCGSSREHAPWALLDYGFRVLLAPSFADIFYNNCFKNGILPIVLAEDIIDSLFLATQHGKAYQVTVDLAQQQILLPTGAHLTFDLDMFRKECLLQGLDDIALTLEKAALITAYEEQRREACPWLFADLL
ncbi:3-isopropylmalate dehydratase small subunit [Desulfopila sp. IMCC35006]|uniref:3-isopropylmalate dehydratase small subunit n=1 Tax=Desulfopila sp. IMCC35006 TaxID=2569542 RepID=UPI0010ABC71D|nr:3-isopropylmalate dehydratase small subunit [Desulfopila sp. IMCC35006]TKB25380.1 3-isopropylmalate dehydratase small subunit [Desulfopila sp. IMCC35006]